MTQANTMAAALEGSDSGSDIFLRKVYLDEFELVANRYPEAKTQLFRLLDEGVAFWSFQGHGAPTSLTHEQVVTYQELNSFDLRHWPVMYAATCDFMKWDSPTRSGAEMLFNNPNGGVIGAISATRPAYISQNGELSAAVGRNMFTRDDRGLIVPLGEGYRLSKNDYRNSEGTPVSNANKLRYVLLGDPAMRMISPPTASCSTKWADAPSYRSTPRRSRPPLWPDRPPPPKAAWSTPSPEPHLPDSTARSAPCSTTPRSR